MEIIDTTKDEWTFIVPIENIELSKKVGNEYRINRVVFITKEKLFRVRKRFGIGKRLSQISKNKITQSILESHKVFAVLKITGVLDSVKVEAMNLVKEELLILSASQLGFGTRARRASPRIFGFGNPSKRESVFIGCTNNCYSASSSIKKSMQNLRFDHYWIAHAKKNFFNQAIRIIRGDIKVKKSWQDEIRRALVLIGESQVAESKFHAFLWNMIVMEMLVSVQGDKYSESIPEHLEAILGWMWEWKEGKYSDKIKELYTKRCEFVHSGNYASITSQDLAFTDEILTNLVTNIVRHHNIFYSKGSLRSFSEKVKAVHLLGLKSKVRPKTFKYIKPHYNQHHYKEMEESL